MPADNPAAYARSDPRVGLITEMISPYRIPIFNALNDRLGGRLLVFCLSERAGRAWPVYRSETRFRFHIQPGMALRPFRVSTAIFYMNVPVLRRLAREGVGPVIVGGYNHLEFAWAWLHSRKRGHPLLLWSESVPVEGPVKRLRDLLKRLAVKAPDGYIVPGKDAEIELRRLGAPPERIFHAPNAVDVEYWASDVPRDPRSGQTRLLYVGHLEPHKGASVLISAMDDPRLRGVALDIVGEGPDRGPLEAKARSGGMTVKFWGHLDRELLRERYRDCDVFVFPTLYDRWGMVLNEAMASGCVPVASSAAGAARELIDPGVTGLLVPPGDVRALRDALCSLVADTARIQTLSVAARERAREYTPDRWVDGVVRALDSMSAAPRGRFRRPP